MTRRPPATAAEPAAQASADCPCRNASDTAARAVKWAALAGLLGSLGVCAAGCLLPFALIAMGVTGAWIGGLDALAPYRWPLIILTFASLGYGFRAAYRRSPEHGSRGGVSDERFPERSARIWLWLATVLAICGIIFQRIEPSLRK